MQDNGFNRDPEQKEVPQEQDYPAEVRAEAEETAFYEIPVQNADPPVEANAGTVPPLPQLRAVEEKKEGEYTATPAGTYEYYDDDAPYLSSENVKKAADISGFTRSGFWPRFLAWLLDLLICGALSGLAAWLQYLAMGKAARDPVFFNHSHREVLIILVGVLYRIVTDRLFGGTLGKRALKLRLISTDTGEAPTPWQIIFRETFGKYLSLFILGIGYLMVFSAEGTLHDRLADTAVVYDL